MKFITALAMATAFVFCGMVFVAGQTEDPNGHNKTVQGCLRQRGGEYVLFGVGPGQKQYHISGDTAQLSSHVGHTVAITGDVTVPASETTNRGTNPTGQNVGTTAAQSAGTIVMQSFQHVSDSCSSAK